MTAACDDAPTSPAGVPATTTNRASPGRAFATIRPGERHFFRLAERIPGFGGYFYDDAGNLHGYVTSLIQADAARAALQDVLRATRRSGHDPATAESPRVEIRQARFAFVELARWRDALSAQGFSRVPGMHFIDVRESRNRIEVEATDASAAAAVRAIAADLGVPAEALDVAVRPRERDFAWLTDHVKPYLGGLKITHYETKAPCTLGFNTDGGSRFVTASHCTRVVGPDYPSPAHFFQPDTTGEYVGEEYRDVPTFTSAQEPACPPGENCRWSDAAIIAYRSAVGAQPMGRIYRTRNRNGSKEIVGQLQITAEAGEPTQGMTLDKIGQQTGWSYGQVFHTCADSRGSTGVLFICQARVSGYAERGDSGSPVFLWHGDSVTMHGVLRAGDSSASYFTYSPMANIWLDFGYVPAY